jgi:MSHA pilin protein MshA
MLRNEKGFTLNEIIAVLVILGILAAVAIPKYISLMDESRSSAAQAAVAEVKARASSWYAVQLMEQQTPTVVSVQASVLTTPDLGADYGVTTAAANATQMSITVGSVRGAALTTAVVGTWVLPQ